MGRRRQARELALQALYIIDTSRVPEPEAFAIVNRKGDTDDAATLQFARELLQGTHAHRAQLDERIEAAAENWTVPRMAAVDRNVLRLAAFELFHRAETPINVIIDEAIEIVRKFSTEEATRFVNGILDKLKHYRDNGGEQKGPR